MKAILEFELPEDEEAFKLATNQVKCSQTLKEFREFLRVHIKYTEVEHRPNIHTIWARLHEIASELGVDLQ